MNNRGGQDFVILRHDFHFSATNRLFIKYSCQEDESQPPYPITSYCIKVVRGFLIGYAIARRLPHRCIYLGVHKRRPRADS